MRAGLTAMVALWSATGAMGAAQPTFRAGVELVRTDVAVLDRGKPVVGLRASDFELTDNGILQEVQSATLEDLPLELTVVLDVSASVSGVRLASLTAATRHLLTDLKADDRISLITFSHRVQRLVPMGRSFDAVRRALERLEGDGATGLRDALYLSLQSSPRTGARPMVLVFSDGIDTVSWLSEREVLQAARRAGTVIHTILMQPATFYEDVAEASGGRMWKIGSDGTLPELFAAALHEMRSRYLLTYSPNPTGADGWHPIKVRLKGRRGDVSARPGYFRGKADP